MSNPFYDEKRYPEWVNASLMTLGALHLLQEASAETSGMLDVFPVLGIDKSTAVVIMTVIGVVRLLALLINGLWKRTPSIRFVTAAGSGVFFTILSLSGYYLVLPLIVMDILAARKAGFDDRATKSK